jgi:hypothetical protein
VIRSLIDVCATVELRRALGNLRRATLFDGGCGGGGGCCFVWWPVRMSEGFCWRRAGRGWMVR